MRVGYTWGANSFKPVMHIAYSSDFQKMYQFPLFAFNFLFLN